MGEFSLSHILILTLILLIFFGPSRLPALGQSIGKAIRGFKEGMNEVHNDTNHSSSQNQNSSHSQISQNQQQPMNQTQDEKSRQNNS